MTTAPVEIRSARRSDLPSLTMLWVAMLEENGRVDPRLEVHPEVRASQATHLAERLEDPAPSSSSPRSRPA